MALATDLVEDWAGGLDRFALPIAQLEELDEKTGGGPLPVLNRLMSHTWRLPDVRETIRLGLIGGGRTPVEALTLVRRHVDNAPIEDAVWLAAAILAAALRGRRPAPAKPNGDDAGNQVAARSASDPTTGSTLPPSGATPA